MAAVAEHVRPAAQRPEILVRVGTEAQACGDQPSLMAARVGVEGSLLCGDTPRQDTDGLG
jgi:hypothetical protein